MAGAGDSRQRADCLRAAHATNPENLRLKEDSFTDITSWNEDDGPDALAFLATATLAKHSSFDAIICIGVVIAGDTNHHEIIADSTATALLDLSIAKKVPVINGILVVKNLAQAQARAGDEINRGKEFAQAALEMAQFTKKWKTK